MSAVNQLVNIFADDIKFANFYAKSSQYYNAVKTMFYSLSMMNWEHKEHEDVKAFMGELEEIINFVDSEFGLNPNDTMTRRNIRAGQFWEPDFFSYYMNVLWSGGYVLEEKYKSFYDPAKTRKGFTRARKVES